MNEIFLSYASEDIERIKTIAKVLESQGWSVFLDRTIPAGKTWRDVIGKALAEARCVVVAWSKESIKSTWVQEEAEEGRERGILIPLLIDDVKPPLGFRSLQVLTLVDWDGKETSPAIQRLFAELTSILGLPPISVEGNEPPSQQKGTSKQDVGHIKPASDPPINTKGSFATPEPNLWIPVLLTIFGWAVGGAIGLTTIFSIGAAFGLAFVGAIGWGIAGSIGGYVMGQALRLVEFSIRKEHIILCTVGWALGGAIGGVLSYEYHSVTGSIIGGSVGGAIGGLITGHGLRLTKPSLHSTQVIMFAFGWAVAGGLGSVLSWAFMRYEYTTTFYTIVGAITGATIGAVGGGLMFGWLSLQRRT